MSIIRGKAIVAISANRPGKAPKMFQVCEKLGWNCSSLASVRNQYKINNFPEYKHWEN